MVSTILSVLQRVLITPYRPDPGQLAFLARAETQADGNVEVTVAIPDARESTVLFGVALASRGLQPLYLRVANGSSSALRLQFRSIDSRYHTPLEAAARCHYSILRRLSAFGFVGWLFSPLLLLIPLKLITAHWANLRMDAFFQARGFHRRPIEAGETVEGFIFTTLDAGTKIVRVYLMALSAQRPDVRDARGTDLATQLNALNQESSGDDIDLTFSLPVPDISVDYEHQQLAVRTRESAFESCDLSVLIERLRSVPAVTSNSSSCGSGDPVNLVLIGSFETLLVAFVGRWDETEAITLATCWKTVRAFLLGTQYRYSPVSPLYLFGRSQDIALQQIRHSINMRMHLRLWLAPFRLLDQPVWVGQVSRDIGVRLTMRTWNLTTHRIDPDIDESRDYVLDDLLDAERVDAAGHVIATSASTPAQPCRNLTGDPFYTDGKRAVIRLSDHRVKPQFINWT